MRSRGAREVAEWLTALGLAPSRPRWRVELVLNATVPGERLWSGDRDTIVRIAITGSEWELTASRPGAVSYIAIADEPRARGGDPDELALLATEIPPLLRIGSYLDELERRLAAQLPRERVHVQLSDLELSARPPIERWIATWPARRA